MRLLDSDEIQKRDSKLTLFTKYKDLLREREASRDALETREREFPDHLASFEALLKKKIPDFCRGAKALSESEEEAYAESANPFFRDFTR